jgi:hypothetical protein
VAKITEKDYFMGRDQRFPELLTAELKTNAAETVRRLNALLAEADRENIQPGINPGTGTHVSSGWRPPAVNDATANAAAKSTHITCEGCDIRDNAERGLARWCLRNLAKLEGIGLWMEDPCWTPTWVHLQTRPPGSGRRVYVPSTAPPKAAPLPEQQ